MNCKLFDIGCHLQSAAAEWWASVGFINKALIVAGIVLVILALSRSILTIVHKIGGWPAVAGAVLAVLGLVLAVLPRRPKPDPDWEDGAPRERYRVPPRKQPAGEKPKSLIERVTGRPE